jgi:hypothetical protein
MDGNPVPHVTDDFKRINGIGPAIERRLHQAGIVTFVQLATLTPEEIADLVRDLAGLSAERIAEQDWPGQARELAAETAQAETPSAEASAGNRQHDASFTVKLLLNEDNSVRGTRVVDNRSKAEDQWAGWNASRMVAFISQQAALRRPEAAPTLAAASVVGPEPPVTPSVRSIPAAAPIPEPPRAAVARDLAGTLRVPELQIIPADVQGPRRVLPQGLPFSVCLTLDLTEAELAGNVSLNYRAVVYAKGLGGPRLVIGEAHNTITPSEHLTIFVPSRTLLPGTYHMEAAVTLTRPSADPITEPGLGAYLEGGMLHIF